MSKSGKKAMVVALAVVAVALLVVQQRGSNADAAYLPENLTGQGRPALIDLGSKTCIPCKLMAPILDELKQEYEGRLDVEFIDVAKTPKAGTVYGIKLIPTQIFYDAAGKELFRHEGFLAKEDILAKWQELGVDLLGDTDHLAERPEQDPNGPALLSDVHPNLASSSLTYAKLSDLPAGVVLKTDGLTIEAQEIADQIAGAPEELREQLNKNAFFLLEQMATRQLLVQEATAAMPQDGSSAVKPSEEQVLQMYLQKLAAEAEVSDEEVAAFYQANRDMVGPATLEQVAPQIRQHLLGNKQQQIVNRHIETLGKRIGVVVSADWVERQAKLAKDNSVDKARASGKPTFASFGADTCIPCQQMAPAREAVREKYEGKANVVYVHVGKEQILASRYGVQGIPLVLFFDADGREVVRHTGMMTQEQIEEQLEKLGVK